MSSSQTLGTDPSDPNRGGDPDDPNSVTDENLEPFTRATDTTGPVSVENHPNLDLLPINCGNIESDRIWGGNRTRLYEMPWMVLLSYNSGKPHQFLNWDNPSYLSLLLSSLYSVLIVVTPLLQKFLVYYPMLLFLSNIE